MLHVSKGGFQEFLRLFDPMYLEPLGCSEARPMSRMGEPTFRAQALLNPWEVGAEITSEAIPGPLSVRRNTTPVISPSLHSAQLLQTSLWRNDIKIQRIPELMFLIVEYPGNPQDNMGRPIMLPPSGPENPELSTIFVPTLDMSERWRSCVRICVL